MNRVVLVILDGVGIADPGIGNAFAQADTPVLNELFSDCPYTELDASGTAVGLPAEYIGNSEVGHLHIGAGRTVLQDLVRINEAIADGSLFENETVDRIVSHVKEHDSRVHITGIASDGGVHGHIDHICSLIEYFGTEDIDTVTHAILDGRDVSPESAEQCLQQIQDTAEDAETGRIGSFMGRFYAMDRDTNWARTRTAYQALVNGEGRNAKSVSEGMKKAHEQDRNDYFVRPTLICGNYAPIGDEDVLLFTNFRKDRARQLTAAFVSDTFDAFPRTHPETMLFVSMKPYQKTFDNPTLFEDTLVEPTLGEQLSNHGISQLRLTESQKEAHVTYFFDGQREAVLPETDTQIFSSATVDSYDEKPQMEAERITDHALNCIRDKKYEFMLVNYPNGDLVGHTGDIDAAVEAVETLDECVSRLVPVGKEEGYSIVLTADHGNCEKMRDDGDMYTAHTLNKVPFCIVNGPDLVLNSGGLANVAGTVLDLLNIESPTAFTESLIHHE